MGLNWPSRGFDPFVTELSSYPKIGLLFSWFLFLEGPSQAQPHQHISSNPAPRATRQKGTPNARVPCVGMGAIGFPWCGSLCEAPCSLIPVATQGAEHKRNPIPVTGGCAEHRRNPIPVSGGGAEHKRNPIPVTGGGAEHKRKPIHVTGGGAEHKLHPNSSTLLVRSTLATIVL